jgi:hypothetical protein
MATLFSFCHRAAVRTLEDRRGSIVRPAEQVPGHVEGDRRRRDDVMRTNGAYVIKIEQQFRSEWL